MCPKTLPMCPKVSNVPKRLTLNCPKAPSLYAAAMAEALPELERAAGGMAGRYTLNSVDPYALNATGFKPLPLNINPSFKLCFSNSTCAVTARRMRWWGRWRPTPTDSSGCNKGTGRVVLSMGVLLCE
jgi:hypothetical protein